ncbi:hypothetical protein TUM20983_36690 [Mycobacterium antarcticum]|uniref:hypothetical protein n=1 Tax=Mycolicibacterium sp. TUM20983 TaxID=3023369 RepID=UPI0023A39342|nr:hypothetical protein [Mycolicibacterium sp. TUM20983]GLP76559.1 hypothetical protein TUM20983_36690 [Mycolicibacterium sp. TUM20983]
MAQTVARDAREWLMEHNGEPLDPQVRAEIFDLNNESTDLSWWSGESVDGQSELTDEAIDWIEAQAKGEVQDKI